MAELRQIDTNQLSVAFSDHGPERGTPAVLLHGFPYSPRAYDAVVPLLVEQGFRVVVPFLRGYGPTRFHDEATPRSGEQAALGQDLIELIEALELDRPVVAGYDWGGRAACVTAAVRPDLVRGLVTVGGYNLFGPASSAPEAPEFEYQRWYQYLLCTERGRGMLESNRRGFCRFLWSLWSPSWAFSDETFAETATHFDNPDFVDVVLHSYRHRAGLVPGDPAHAALATRLEQEQPRISVPTIALTGEEALRTTAGAKDRAHFGSAWESRSYPRIGHNFPQEAPEAMAQAVVDLGASHRVQ